MRYMQARMADGSIASDQIVLIREDGVITHVPKDESNADWRDYQAWIAAGNQPLPADSA